MRTKDRVTNNTRIDNKDFNFRLKYNDLELDVNGYELSDVFNILNLILNDGNEVSNNNSKHLTIEPSKRRSSSNKEGREKPIDINMNDLKLNSRLPRTSTDFRCPNCGQSFIANIVGQGGNMWVFRTSNDEGKSSLGKIIIEDVIINDGDDKEELATLYHNLNKLTSEPVVLVYMEGDKCGCPVCKTEDSLTEWMDAYSSPLSYFESDALCDICGDEAEILMTESSSYARCEDDCIGKVKQM